MTRTAISILLAAALATLAGCPAKPLPDAVRFAKFRGGKDAPTYHAVLVNKAPVVDGKMDAAYKAAEPVRFVFINGGPRLPSGPTTARAVCTKDALYIFYRCRYRGRDGIRWSARTHDAEVWHDNSVEVFLDPSGTGGSNYYQVIVNPGGVRADLLARRREAWNPDLKVAAKVTRGVWTAELAIPFKQLELTPGRINKVWRMNLTRFSLAPAEDTSWCVLGDYSSHTPNRFGYLWLDAGNIMNVSAQDMQPWEPILGGDSLAGWRVVRGEATALDGMMVVEPAHTAVVAMKKPLPYGDLVISADVISDKQLRFMFARDPNNKKMGFYATFINHINESNVAMMRDWEYWAPPMGFHLTIPHYGPCPMADRRWYRCEVRFRPKRVQLLLDGRLLMETPNLYPKARWFGLHIIGGGRVKNIRIRKLVTVSPAD